MRIITNPQVFQKTMEALREKGKQIGFVPTMGALHHGHLELMRRSKQENDVTAVSIFVNPTQFGPKEDFRRYPRPAARDQKLLIQAEVDFLLMPSVAAMYPAGTALFVDLNSEQDGLTQRYCGQTRPGHFRGVLTVCAKLFNIARPHRVYMGAKDYQQTVVIDRLIRELHLGIKMVRVPTVRESDGLALSSRNIYLSPADRRRARALSQTLQELQGELQRGKRNLKALLQDARRKLAHSVDKLDYLEAADPVTLEPLAKPQKHMVLLTACTVGKTRLIDNVIINLP